MNNKKELSGIGGWLIFFCIYLFSSLSANLASLTSGLELLSPANERATEGLEYDSSISSFKNLMYFENSGIAIIVIINVVLIFKFFQKKRNFKSLLIFWYIFTIVYSFIDASLANQYFGLDNNFFPEILAMFLACSVWLAYFHMSVRVKNTFIN
jgi:hypothetical protein